MLKVGTPVKVKRANLTGTIAKLVVVNDGQSVEYLVAYQDLDDVTQQRYFTEDELEVQKEA